MGFRLTKKKLVSSVLCFLGLGVFVVAHKDSASDSALTKLPDPSHERLASATIDSAQCLYEYDYRKSLSDSESVKNVFSAGCGGIF